MEKYFKYTFRVKADDGIYYLSTVSYSQHRAKYMIMKAENCPDNAVEFVSKNPINI